MFPISIHPKGMWITALSLCLACSLAAAQRIPIPAGFPDASTTGYSGTLTPSGGITVTTPGTILENLRITGGLSIQASNVTVRNCEILGGTNYGVQATWGHTGILFEDCVIDGRGSTGIGMYLGNTTVRRCEVKGYQDCIYFLDNVTVEDSWLHDLYEFAESHNDALQCRRASNGTFRHNTIQALYQTQTSCFLMKADTGPITNILIEDNFLSGGGYIMYLEDRYGHPVTNAVIRGNIFEKNSYDFGPTAIYPTYPDVTIECNIFHTGEPIPNNPPCASPPMADAGSDQTLTDDDGDGFALLVLDGTASTAPPGETLTGYLWTEGGSLVGVDPVTVTALTVGVHTITLQVTDSTSAKATDEVVITVMASGRKPGDADGDGDVDLEDFVALKKSFGLSSGATLGDGDFDEDGDVDLDDFTILKQSFGS